MVVKVRMESNVTNGNYEEFIQVMKRERVGPDTSDFEFD